MDANLKVVPEFLAKQRDHHTPPELQHFFLDFQGYWEQLLWHQLTNSLDDFFKVPESGPQRLSVFKDFVLTFADKINKLKLVELGLAASQQCKGALLLPQQSLRSVQIHLNWKVKRGHPSRRHHGGFES